MSISAMPIVPIMLMAAARLAERHAENGSDPAGAIGMISTTGSRLVEGHRGLAP